MNVPPLLAAVTGAEDSTLPAWISTALYLWLAMLCGWTWWLDRAGRRPFRPLGPPVWLVLAVLFATLGVVKPLGLQEVLADWGRKVAKDGDWYEVRRRYQFAVILLIGASAVVSAAALGWVAARKASARNLAALAPVVVLLGFLGVRAVSLHQVDAVLDATIGGIRWGRVVELTLLAATAAALVRRSNQARRELEPDDGRGVRRYAVPGGTAARR